MPDSIREERIKQALEASELATKAGDLHTAQERVYRGYLTGHKAGVF